MIVYNITIKILPEIEEEWVQWQKQEHIPDVMASCQFTDYKFYRLLDAENDGVTYIVQYFARSRENFDCYIKDTAPALREKAFNRWGNRFIAFRTIMEPVN